MCKFSNHRLKFSILSYCKLPLVISNTHYNHLLDFQHNVEEFV